ncbi:hypothetical protein T4E_4300 [Trichinella pseudospiralis]|uniref:Uncharacterized protein n=1 Tax=Trichinella pseudospiralis TaxID=6337 RepID=A0A0V0XWG1_TRIPS|nr:hypothetical protein T4E_4300 [Trichinella pseudospiralis]
MQLTLNIRGVCVLSQRPVEFPRILAAFIDSSFAPSPLIPYNLAQLPESCKKYHRPSTDLHVKYLSQRHKQKRYCTGPADL